MKQLYTRRTLNCIVMHTLSTLLRWTLTIKWFKTNIQALTEGKVVIQFVTYGYK